jgi:hypothetical protein
MSFQRTRYDPGEAKQYINESAAAASYPLNTPVMCGNCFPSDPRIVAQKTGVSLNTGVSQRFYSGPVDVETDLLGINRPLSRVPSEKYNARCPNCNCTHIGQPCGDGVQTGCQPMSTDSFPAAAFRKSGQRCEDNNLMDFPSCFFSVEDTRLTNPPSNIRGMTMNRFIPLLLPPQEQVLFPGEANVPSRIVFKDNHRACVPNLRTISADPLPPAKPLPCPLTNPSCAPFTGSMYQYDVCG